MLKEQMLSTSLEFGGELVKSLGRRGISLSISAYKVAVSKPLSD
jgi:hypothetical protein